MILETFVLTATNNDVLSTGRLNAIPYNGTITMDFLADLADASNNWALSVQLPDGSVPVDAQTVPASSSGADGVLDERELMRMSFQAPQGGHFTVVATETGTAVLAARFVLTP